MAVTRSATAVSRGAAAAPTTTQPAPPGKTPTKKPRPKKTPTKKTPIKKAPIKKTLTKSPTSITENTSALVKKAAADGKKPFRNFPKGTGGTYQILPTDQIRAIGVTSCDSSLGLWVPINSTTYFVAHFDFEVLDDQGDPKVKRSTRDYEIGPACYRAAVMWTKMILAGEQWKGRWGPVTERMSWGLEMVCPRARAGGKVRKYLGDAIAEGVTEFFKVVTDPLARVNRYENMIVEYNPWVGRSYPTKRELANKFQAIDEHEGRGIVILFTEDGRTDVGDEWEGPYMPEFADDGGDDSEDDSEEDIRYVMH